MFSGRILLRCGRVEVIQIQADFCGSVARILCRNTLGRFSWIWVGTFKACLLKSIYRPEKKIYNEFLPKKDMLNGIPRPNILFERLVRLIHDWETLQEIGCRH